ncbi:hypothetical protein BU14_0185s0025 [Porphyra umbilicalis]|uniref:Uncharacterized protein n=1 Tax=Porphyra umbilicalis TaxID=2786 RepID=A0A1X6P735_PORUM|nr:hypothetical protein BU14_0185s0025 [Porphyra umbilicalis]|eukprot:OSX76565.1 hypothetical protein BU14_0185s0025 [Porphyra umbilicalis]
MEETQSSLSTSRLKHQTKNGGERQRWLRSRWRGSLNSDSVGNKRPATMRPHNKPWLEGTAGRSTEIQTLASASADAKAYRRPQDTQIVMPAAGNSLARCVGLGHHVEGCRRALQKVAHGEDAAIVAAGNRVLDTTFGHRRDGRREQGAKGGGPALGAALRRLRQWQVDGGEVRPEASAVGGATGCDPFRDGAALTQQTMPAHRSSSRHTSRKGSCPADVGGDMDAMHASADADALLSRSA